MNIGEHLWETPNGDTPERIGNHPALQGVDLPNTGVPSHPVTMVAKTLLITAELPRLHALDKRTGERLGTVALPASGQCGMMGYQHEGPAVHRRAGGGIGSCRGAWRRYGYLRPEKSAPMGRRRREVLSKWGPGRGSSADQSQGGDHDAGAGQRRADDPFHQSQLEADQLGSQLGAGNDVAFAIVGSLTHGVRDGVHLRASVNGVGVEHTFTLPRIDLPE